jgi:hypothetical protein
MNKYISLHCESLRKDFKYSEKGNAILEALELEHQGLEPRLFVYKTDTKLFVTIYELDFNNVEGVCNENN